MLVSKKEITSLNETQVSTRNFENYLNGVGKTFVGKMKQFEGLMAKVTELKTLIEEERTISDTIEQS